MKPFRTTLLTLVAAVFTFCLLGTGVPSSPEEEARPADLSTLPDPEVLALVGALAAATAAVALVVRRRRP